MNLNVPFWTIVVFLSMQLSIVQSAEQILDKGALKRELNVVIVELKVNSIEDFDKGTNAILRSVTFVKLWDTAIWDPQDLIDISLTSTDEREVAVATYLAHSLARRDWITWFKTVVGNRNSLVRKKHQLLAIALCPGEIYNGISRFAFTPGIREILTSLLKEKPMPLTDAEATMIADSLILP